MSFWYHMYGSSIGTLNVYINSLSGVTTTLSELNWQLSGNRGNKWLQGRLPISSKTSYQVHFNEVLWKTRYFKPCFMNAYLSAI